MDARQELRELEELDALEQRTSGQSPREQVFGPEQNMVPPQQEGTTFGQFANAAVQGVGQGMTLGFMDEMVGAVTPGVPYEQARDESRQRLEQAQFDHPILTMASEMIGSMAPAMWASKLIKSMKSAAAVGAVEGATYGVGTSEGIPSLLDVVIPAGLGGGSGMLSQLLSTSAKKLLTTNDPLGRVAKADELNYPLSLGERTDSNAIRKIETALENYPLGTSPHKSLGDRQPILNKKVLEDLGLTKEILEESNLVTNKVSQAHLNTAKKNIGKEFEKLKTENDWYSIDLKPFEKISEKAGKGIVRDKSIVPMINNFKAELFRNEPGLKGGVTAAQYMEFRKELSGKAASEMSSPQGSRRFGKELFEMVEELDNQVLGLAEGNVKLNMWKARKQWQSYLAADRGQAIDRATGDVNVKTMLNNLSRNNVESGDLVDALLMGKKFPPVTSKPSSGFGVLQSAGTIGIGTATGNLIPTLIAPPLLSSALKGISALNKSNKKLANLTKDLLKRRAPIDNLLNILLNQEESTQP